MELSDLVGLHDLTAAEEDTATGSQCAIMFTLDGVTYRVEEDEDDGYRSHARDIEVVERTLKNQFPACRVMATHETNSNDVLVLTDVTTGLEVLRVGTENTDDYYPYYGGQLRPAFDGRQRAFHKLSCTTLSGISSARS